KPIPFKQSDVKFKGHAIEFRLYAESPEKNFMPAIGKISKLNRPEADFIREDFALEAGDEISPFYDAMISKLIIRAKDRTACIEQSLSALKDYEIEGVETSIPFHKWILGTSEFKEGGFDIGFVEREFNPECLKELAARELKDPSHIQHENGLEFIEQFRFFSPEFNSHYVIELIHRNDGIFVAIPKSQDGKIAPPKNRRASNGKNAVLKAITEVLNSKPPQEIFN
ncbi:MAG: hypothetical protein KDD56_05290, partial [Bdellovibrionales bacterium]|nr:hypothetical protein [Bdellovibrionales bacterium]